MRTPIASTPAMYRCFVLCIIVIVAESFNSLRKRNQNVNQHRFNERLWLQRVDGDGNGGRTTEIGSFINRREWLATTASSAFIFPAVVATSSPFLIPNPASAAEEGSKTMSASWSALSGLESNDEKVVKVLASHVSAFIRVVNAA